MPTARRLVANRHRRSGIVPISDLDFSVVDADWSQVQYTVPAELCKPDTHEALSLQSKIQHVREAVRATRARLNACALSGDWTASATIDQDLLRRQLEYLAYYDAKASASVHILPVGAPKAKRVSWASDRTLVAVAPRPAPARPAVLRAPCPVVAPARPQDPTHQQAPAPPVRPAAKLTRARPPPPPPPVAAAPPTRQPVPRIRSSTDYLALHPLPRPPSMVRNF